MRVYRLIMCEAFLWGCRACLVSELPTKKLKVALWQMTTISDNITLLVLFHRPESTLWLRLENWRMTISVTCRKEQLAEVSNWQFHHLLAHLGVLKDLAFNPTHFQTELSNGCGFDLEIFLKFCSVRRQSFISKRFQEF